MSVDCFCCVTFAVCSRKFFNARVLFSDLHFIFIIECFDNITFLQFFALIAMKVGGTKWKQITFFLFN